MSRGHRETVVLADYKSQKMDEGAIPIKAGDETFLVPPPAVWSDEVIQAMEAEELVRACRGLLGDEPYARFVAAGGSAALLMSIIEDTTGGGVGESAA